MPLGASLVAYLTGFSIATVALKLFGWGIGAAMLKVNGRLGRVLDGLVAAAGAFLAAAQDLKPPLGIYIQERVYELFPALVIKPGLLILGELGGVQPNIVAQIGEAIHSQA